MGRRRVSYARLAQRIGTSRQNLWGKLSSEKAVNHDDLTKIADALDTPAWEFMRRAEQEEKETA